jgi:hypothetical protein
MSKAEVAEYIGVKPDSLGRMELPIEDALTGPTKGYLKTTIDEWVAQRPGRGNWNGKGVNAGRDRPVTGTRGKYRAS